MRMRRRASSRFQIDIFPQRFSTPSVFFGAVRTSASSRRRHRRIFLASSRGRRSRSGSVRRSRSEVEFPARLRLPPPPLLPRVLRKLAVSTGVFLLITPHWPTQKWFPALLRLQVEEVFRLPMRPEVLDLTSGRPPLPRLPLLAWKLFGGSTASTSRTPPSPTLAADGEDRRLDGMIECGSVSTIFSIPEDFLSIPSI